MGSELSELVVKLTFDHGDAKSQIQQFTRQISGVETSFKAAAAEAGGFTTATDKAKAHAAMLTQQLELQKRATEQLKGMMGNAQGRLESATKAYQDQAQKVSDLKAKNTALKAEIGSLESAMRESKAATGDNTEEYIGMALKLDELNKALAENEKSLKSQELQLKKNDREVAASEKSLQSATQEYDKARLSQANMAKELDDLNRKIQKHVIQLEEAGKKLKAYGDRTREVGQAQSRIGQGLTAGVTAPILAAGGASVGAAIGWESDFAGVKKTVEGTPEELKKINDELLEMSTNIPTSAGELATIGANAGQLGIATENVTGFTRTIADLKETTNLTAEQGAQDFAKFANITKMPQTAFSNMGSAVVALGNNLATTESDIVNMAMNLAAAGTQAKISQPQILGIAAALSSLGLEAQAGGTAFSKTITEMQVAVETGNADLKEYAKVAGMTASEFAEAFRTDAAGALSSFIAGLSSGSQSAVVMLDKMGITETRMRDALLRASGAGDLLKNSIQLSTDAWQKNVALTNEANVRYSTAQSKITMAGNAAKAAAISFGGPFLEAIKDGADGVTDLANRFAALDEATKKQIITFAGLAAAAGPTIMAIGKGNEAVAAVATGLGKFTTSIAAAGGGVKGFVSALGGALGPVGVVALGAAVLVAAYKWYDYASGAKAAREATEKMIETAKKWRDTQATTIFDTGNDPFQRFGLDKSQFGGGGDESKDWLSRLNKTWTDGKGETKQIIADYVNEFKSGTDKVREAIEARKATQEKYGVKGDKTTEDDLKKLKAYDKEVEALLKKRKNGTLTEDDQKRLEQIIQERMEIQLKYATGEGGGYDSLVQAVEAEKARLAAEGQTPGADLYGDALTGAAQGYQTQVDAINQSYQQQYTDIMAITDEQERQDALTQLNLEHTQALKKAQEEYQAVLGKYAPETFQTPEMQQAQSDLQTLTDMISTIQADEKVTGDELAKLAEFTDGMDEGKLASLKAVLDQLKAGGLGDLTIGGTEENPIKASDLLGGYDTVAAFLEANKGEWTGGLSEMFGAVDAESQRIQVTMGLTPESQTLMDSLSEMEKAGVTVLINAYKPTETTLVTPPETMVEAMIGAYKAAVDAGVQEPDAKVEALIAAYNEAPEGATVAVPKEQVDALIGAYNEATNAGVAAPSATVNALISAYQASDGATTAPPNDTVTAIVSKYESAADAELPKPTVTLKASVDFSGLDRSALDAYYEQNPDAKPSIVVDVGLKQGWAMLLQGAYTDGKLRVFGADGAKLNVTPEVVKKIGVTDIWTEGVDENGNPTIDIILTPKLGTQEAVGAAQSNMDQKPESILPAWLTDNTASEKVDAINGMATAIEKLNEAGESEAANSAIFGPGGIVEQLTSLSPDNLKSIGDYIAAAMAALSSGTLTPEQTSQVQEQLNALLDMIRAADQYLGVGNDISAGVASGMTGYGWTGDATTVATSIEAALRGALESQSPAQKLVPVGSDAAAGIGQGLAAYSFAADAAKAAAGVGSAMELAMKLADIGTAQGKALMDGVISGLADKKDDAVRKAKEIADAIKETIRKAWDINSPAGEGIWLGEMLVAGVGQGMDRMMPDVVGRLEALELRSMQATQGSKVVHYKEGDQNISGPWYLNDKLDYRALMIELEQQKINSQRGRGAVYVK